MQITLEVPEDIARDLGGAEETVSRSALEGLALEGYRTRRLSEGQIRRMLGFDTRWDVHAFLKSHGVDLNYGEDDLRQDLQFVDEFGRWPS